ncbi:MAG: hypothetical protein QM711_18485 [Micropruina sp.]|uniref:hypothetical protein n=1 Tax=Micropruina sp. TaxID=2737536 RepID=UPI0039E65F54
MTSHLESDAPTGNSGREKSGAYTAPLTPRAVEQLVEIRIQLEEAVRAVRSAGKYRRAQAAVAIDAVVERSSSLIAIARGLPLSPQGKLEDTISKLTQDLGSAWRPTAVLPDVKQLRRVRNAAQHEGIPPDPPLLSTLCRSAETYVVTLIDAHFSVDVKSIVLSQAIQDTQWRSQFQEAENRLAEGGSGIDLALGIIRRLLASAEKRWRRYSQPIEMSLPYRDKATRDLLRRVEAHLRTEEWVFATHPAEARWVRDVLDSLPATVDADEAERALSYTFAWLTSLEMAIAEWPVSRVQRAQVRKRLIGQPGEIPSISDELSIVEDHAEGSSVRVQLRGVPPHDAYDEWSERLSKRLPDEDGIHWTVHHDGTVEWYIRPSTPEAAAHGAAMLQQALLDSSLPELPAPLLPPAQSGADLGAENQALRRGLQAGELPPWVTDITLEVLEGDAEPWVVVTVSSLIGTLADGLWGLRQLIDGYPQVSECNAAGIDFNKVRIKPALPPPEIARVLADVHRVIDAELREREEHQRLKAARLAALEQAVRTQLRLPGTTTPR